MNLLLVGNKCDLPRDGAAAANSVTREEGEALAGEYGVQFYETSAKENINVDEAFFALAKETMGRLNKQDKPHARNRGRELRADDGGSGGKKGC